MSRWNVQLAASPAPAVLLALVLGPPSTAAVDPVLLRDANATPRNEGSMGSPGLQDGLELDGVFYFPARDRAHGRELWRTDGTRTGTWRVDDLCPGRCSSDPQPLATLEERLFLVVDDGVHGAELWSTTGRRGAARLIHEGEPGPGSGLSRATELARLGDRLYFATRGVLWRTDGTRDGTEPVVSLDGPHSFRELTPLGGFLYFRGARQDEEPEIWRTDGTAAGTERMTSLCRDQCLGPPTNLAALGDRLIFAASGGLWALEGRSARKLADVSSASEPALWKGRLYFPSGEGLLVTDGTPGGTRRVAETGRRVLGVTPLRDALLLETRRTLWGLTAPGGTPRELTSGRFFSPGIGSPLTRVGGRAYFRTAVQAGDRLRIEALWTTDGTPEGTRKVTPLCGAVVTSCLNMHGSPDPRGAAALGDLYLFALDASDTGTEPWISDSTASGTRPLADLWTDPGSADPNTVLTFRRPIHRAPAALGDTLVYPAFHARIPDEPYAAEYRLWATDGTPAGTEPVGPVARVVGGLSRVGEAVLFAQGEELWRFEGMNEPLELVSAEGGPTGVTFVHRDRLYFGRDLGCKDELWVTDGSAAETRMLGRFAKNCLILPTGAAALPGPFAGLGPAVVLAGRDELAETNGLWLADAADELHFLAQVSIYGGDAYGASSAMASAETGVVFSAIGETGDPYVGHEIWMSDGTPEGTHPIVDLRTGPRGSYPGNLTPVSTPTGDLVVFAADDGRSGMEAWVSDGTAAGTGRLAGVAPGLDASSPTHFIVAGDRLFFWADDPLHGRELRVLPLGALAEAVEAGGVAPPTPPGAWLETPALAGFRVKARITPAGTDPLPGRLSANCIAETLCIEGALAGRPEGFVKVIGPRPNGHLWVQISRFTPSELEVWIEQLGSGAVRYYRLRPVGPGEPGISGRQDRRAFVP